MALTSLYINPQKTIVATNYNKFNNNATNKIHLNKGEFKINGKKIKITPNDNLKKIVNKLNQAKIPGIKEVKLKSNGIVIISKNSKLKIDDVKNKVLLNVMQNKLIGSNKSDLIQVVKHQNSAQQSTRVKIEYKVFSNLSRSANIDKWFHTDPPDKVDERDFLHLYYNLLNGSNNVNQQPNTRDSIDLNDYIVEGNRRFSTFFPPKCYDDPNWYKNDSNRPDSPKRVVNIPPPKITNNDIKNLISSNTLVNLNDFYTDRKAITNNTLNNRAANNSPANGSPISSRRNSAVINEVKWNLNQTLQQLQDNKQHLLDHLQNEIIGGPYGINNTEDLLVKNHKHLEDFKNKLSLYQDNLNDINGIYQKLDDVNKKLITNQNDWTNNNIDQLQVIAASELDELLKALDENDNLIIFNYDDLRKFSSYTQLSNSYCKKILNKFNKDFSDFYEDHENAITYLKNKVTTTAQKYNNLQEYLNGLGSNKQKVLNKISHIEVSIQNTQDQLDVINTHKTRMHHLYKK